MKIAVFDIDDTVLRYQPDILDSDVIASGKQKAVDLAEEGYAIAYVSARTEAERDDVIRKLKTENFPCDESMVYLIPDFNMNIPRFKKKSLEELQTKGDVEYFFDDTKINRSVAEKLGIPNVEEIEIIRTDMSMKEYSMYLDRLKSDIKEGVRRNLRVRKVSEKKEEKTSTTGLEMFPEQFYDSLAKSGAIKDDSIEIGLLSIDSIEFVENKITELVKRSGSTDPLRRSHSSASYGTTGEYAGDGAHRPAGLGDNGSSAKSYDKRYEPAYNLTRNINTWENPDLPFTRYKNAGRVKNFSRVSKSLGYNGQQTQPQSSLNTIISENSNWVGGTIMQAEDPPPRRELEAQELKDIFGFKTYKYNFTTPLIYEWTHGREDRVQYQVPNSAMQYPLPIYDVGNKNDAGMERSAKTGFWNDWWQNEVGDKVVYDADGEWDKIEMNDIYWSNKTAKNMVLEMEILSEDKKTRYILEVVIVRNGDYALPIPLIYPNIKGKTKSMKKRQIKGTETQTITFLPGQNASKLMADMDAKDSVKWYENSDERSSNFAVSSEERASWSGGILFHARKIDEIIDESSPKAPPTDWYRGKELKPAEWKYIFGKLREKGFAFPLENQLDTWMNATANRKTYSWLVFTTSVLPMIKRSNYNSHNKNSEHSGFLYFTASKQERDDNKGLGFDIGDGRMIFWIEPTDTTVKDDLDATIAVAEKWMPESTKEGDYDYYKERTILCRVCTVASKNTKKRIENHARRCHGSDQSDKEAHLFKYEVDSHDPNN